MRNNLKSFSLLEILIAVIIVGIIASLGLANYQLSVEKARAKEVERILLDVVTAQKRYQVEHDGVYATTQSELGYTINSSMGGLNVNLAMLNLSATALGIAAYRYDTEGETATASFPPVGTSASMEGMYTIYTPIGPAYTQMTIYCGDGAQHAGICKRLGYTTFP